MTENIIKPALFAIIVLALLLVWLLPKTAVARRTKMNEKIYLATSWIGLLFGLAGLAAVFVFKERTVIWHLWEVLVMPWALLQCYWLMVRRAQAGHEIVDEKQQHDMGQAAGLALAAAILGMSLLFLLPDALLPKALLFYPFFLFLVMTFFSAATIYFFKKA